jgi:hypothetical protein
VRFCEPHSDISGYPQEELSFVSKILYYMVITFMYCPNDLPTLPTSEILIDDEVYSSTRRHANYIAQY